jgi:pilus assembly protein TadC
VQQRQRQQIEETFIDCAGKGHPWMSWLSSDFWANIIEFFIIYLEILFLCSRKTAVPSLLESSLGIHYNL